MVGPNSILLSPVTRENLNEKVVAQIKTLIFSKGLQIGERLPCERELARRFGVSRTVMREALKSLEQSGLVEIRTGAKGGAFVAYKLHIPLFHATYDLFTAGELTLAHFYEARKAIECTTVRLAALNATAEQISHLYALNRKIVDELNDAAKLGEYNMAFHLAVAEMAGNPLMKLIVQSISLLLKALFTGWERVRTRSYIDEMYKRHQAIIDAIAARDLNRCEEMMARDTEYTQKLDYLRDAPGAV